MVWSTLTEPAQVFLSVELWKRLANRLAGIHKSILCLSVIDRWCVKRLDQTA
jgi:hypothetical protein